MLNYEHYIYQLLRIAVGSMKAEDFRDILSAEDWKVIFRECVRHCVHGVAFEGLKRLKVLDAREGGCALCNMERGTWLNWASKVGKLEKENANINAQCMQLCNKLLTSGKWCQVLKGQGLALLYDNPLSRQCGDIDIWVVDKNSFVDGKFSLSKNRRLLVSMSRRLTGRREDVTYHHTDFHVFNDTMVELHFTPTWMFCPWHNKRLQRYFNNYIYSHINQYDERSNNASDCNIFIPTPDIEFNTIFCLVHIFRHVFQEGIGLRQITDYYEVISRLEDSRKADIQKTLKDLGLYKFTAALMWVMCEVFGNKDIVVCEPDEKEGRWLMKEIMLAGNFGHEDERMKDVDVVSRSGRLKFNFIHSMKMFTHYPLEAAFDMPWRVCHYFWRKQFD